MINDLNAHPTGSGSSLVNKLTQAQQATTTAGACASLAAFDGEVQKQSGKQVPADRAQQLLASSAQVQRQLAC